MGAPSSVSFSQASLLYQNSNVLRVAAMNNFQNMISLLYQGVAAARATLETPKTG